MKQRIHILGICGTFMGGIAALCRELGHEVTGWDRHVYPPMSTQLEKLGIELTDSLSTEQFTPQLDLVIIGNAMSRGHPLVEFVMRERIPYISGPQWLGEEVLRHKQVLAIAGTHGKTTTSSMLVRILEQAGLNPSFLVGGIVKPYQVTARHTDSPYFVIEADEYDTAFFDKRSKFLHYHSDVFAINNLEFDHADIFPDLAAIQTQFAFGLRTVPDTGYVLAPTHDPNIQAIVQKGCWSSLVPMGEQSGWHAVLNKEDGSDFDIFYEEEKQGRVAWSLLGRHNVENALTALAAAHCVGISAEQSCIILSDFEAPARRLETIAEHQGFVLYDDFAHHPTAIQTTLEAMRASLGDQRIIAIFEPRSNTMKAGVHKGNLYPAFEQADHVYALQPEGSDWSLQEESQGNKHWTIANSVEELEHLIVQQEREAGHWVIMSNGGFGGLHQKLIQAIASK